MIEIQPCVIENERFLGILIYLPKCTVRLLMNMKIICLDDSFSVKTVEKRCHVPLISCTSNSFERMLNRPCTEISESARRLGICETMSVKEAILCAFQKDGLKDS